MPTPAGPPAAARLEGRNLGYWGSSYSGAHAVWVAANEPRAACAVGQVAADDSLDLARTPWRDSGIDVVEHAREQAIRRARGEIAPLPEGTDKAPNLNGWAHLDKVIEYRPVDDAGRITIPLLVIDAEHEELFEPSPRRRAGDHAGAGERRARGVPCHPWDHALRHLPRGLRRVGRNGARVVQRLPEGLRRGPR